MRIATPADPEDPSRTGARVIATATTLLCFVMACEAVVGSAPGYHRIGAELLAIVGVSVVGAFQSRGAPRLMLRWLVLLSLLQVVLWGWNLLSRTATPLAISLIGLLPLAGWLLAITRVAVEIRATGTD
jgi:hypothetical protein